MTLIRESDLLTKISDLLRRVKVLETANRLALSTARQLTVVSDDGTIIGQVGGLPALADPDGLPQSGFLFRRSDGTLALSLYDPDSSAGGFNQYLGIWDRAGDLVISDDTTSGQGLARPYIAFPFASTAQSNWGSSTSTSFGDVFLAYINKQHPYVEVYVQMSAAASTVGEVQLVQGSTVIGAAQQVTGASTDTLTWIAPVDGAHGDVIDLHIAARRVSGTGAVSTQVFGAWGRQTP